MTKVTFSESFTPVFNVK